MIGRGGAWQAAATLADGGRTRIAPQFYYYSGSFGLLGEYTNVSQDVSRSGSEPE